MEKKVIITKRFRNNTLRVYQYLLKEFSAKTAYNFLAQLEKRIDFIIKNPEAGKKSGKRKNVDSILFTPHSKIEFTSPTESVSQTNIFNAGSGRQIILIAVAADLYIGSEANNGHEQNHYFAII